MESEPKRPGNYLSIDGGPSGLPALYTLEELFNRLQDDLKLDEELAPCRWFDIIIGTGRGAIITILLGKLGLTVSKAIEAYMKLEPLLSAKPAQNEGEREKNRQKFKKAFLEILSEANVKEDAPMLEETGTKTIICVANTLNLSVVHLLRSYPVRGVRAAACTILEAACACVAFPDRFTPVIIGSGHKKITLVDAMAGYANPTKELLKEAQKISGDAEVAIILSIGAGKWSVQATTEHGRGVHLDEALRRGVIGSEQVHQDLQDRLIQSAIYFRFNVERELDDKPDIIIAHLSAYLGDAMTSSRLDEAIRRIQIRPSGTRLKDINSLTVLEIKLKPRPRLVPNFIGREDILEAIRETHFGHHQSQRQTPVITILSGIGGLGKTQTALKFALEFEEMYPDIPIYFLDASAPDTLKADLETVIRSQGTAYHSKSYQDTLVWLVTEVKNWLVILDNADDPNMKLVDYIPRCAHGNVIITTRNATHALLAPNNSHALDGLSTSDATMLLLTVSNYPDTEENQNFAERIAVELGCLPLALAHAAGYIFVHRCLETYLDMYRSNRARILSSINSSLLHDYQSSVVMTIEMSLEKLTGRARDIIHIFSHLQASSIPHSMIAKAAERRFQRVEKTELSSLQPQTLDQAEVLRKIFCPGGEWSEFDFNEAIHECLRYSLLQLTTQDSNRFYSMHVLVQSHLQSTGLIHDCQPRQLVCRLLGSAITIGKEYEFLAFHRLLLFHIRLVQIEDVTEAGDHHGLGYVLNELGDARLALVHQEKCVEMWRELLGVEDQRTIEAVEYLAISYKEAGKSQAALELEEEVVTLRRRLFGPEHPDTVRAMGNLATSYLQVGKTQVALKLQEEVVSLQKKLLGSEHPDTVLAMGNLALSYENLGKNQAVPELEEGLLLCKRLLGPEHPTTVRTMGNLAISYKNLGNNQAAAELEEEVLLLCKRLLGPEHPNTLQVMCNLAISYRGVGNLQVAVELQEKALSLQKRLFGPDHPDTVRFMGNLAVFYEELGRDQDTLELEEEVLSLKTRLLGLQHPHTLVAMRNLLNTYRELDMQAQRLSLLRTAVQAHEAAESRGIDHPYTIELRNELQKISAHIANGSD